MLCITMVYTVRQMAKMAGVSVRTLHHYDHIELLKPSSYGGNGYRYYDEEAAVRLQQVLFFRELGFSLDEIRDILQKPGFDVVEALRSHRSLLSKKAERIAELLRTVDRTISHMEGESEMEIREYYQGFSEEQIEQYREEVRQRWGEDTLRDSEARVERMGKERFADVQAEGDAMFRSMAELMPRGAASAEVQHLVARWREWLENFATYSDEAVLGLARTYSEDARFAAHFVKYHPDLPAFFTAAVEHWAAARSQQDS
jgi:MerR family transcriptional regulator, thiopeptide resistance regulator